MAMIEASGAVSAPIRMTAIDRIVGYFSPASGLKRYSSRASLAALQRLYDGGQSGRLTSGWAAGRTSADSEIALAGGMLRDRMRDLVRNNGLAGQAVQVLVNNFVGSGIRPRAKGSSKRANKKVDKLWAIWSAQCDRHGHTNFEGLLALAVREMVEGGEVFAVRRRLPAKPGRVPLEIELYEADHLDDGRARLSGVFAEIRDGIEYDRSGRRNAYYLFPEHPGGPHRGIVRTNYDSVRIPAGDVAHLFERQRLQNRGVPWGTPALAALRDHGDWQVAEMVRKKTEACLVGIVIGDEEEGGSGGVNAVQDADGNVIESFRPGMLAYSRGGKDVKFNTPASSAGVAEWNRVQLHLIAAGFRVPYALMTGDLSQANYSSNRAGLNEFRRMIDLIQWTVIIPMFCAKIWEWFCDAAYTAGMIDSPDVPCEWAPPKFESVNPKQDAETDLLEVRAGFATRSQQIAKRGYDPIEVEEEMAEDNDRADKAGLVLDSDPRRMSRAGQEQAGVSGERPAKGESDSDAGTDHNED